MKRFFKTIRFAWLPLVLVCSVFVINTPSLPVQAQADENSVYCKEDIKKLPIEEQLKNPCVNSDIKEVREKAVQLRQEAAKRTCNTKANPSSPDCTGLVALITQYVNPLIRLVSIVAGILMAISMVWAAIQYSSAGGDANKVAEAKSRMTNTVLSLIFFVFSLSILEWLIPGNILITR